jgi:hypothetical protein
VSDFSETDLRLLSLLLRKRVFEVDLTLDEEIDASFATLKFLDIETFVLMPDIIRFNIDNKFGLVAREGWIIPPIYDYVQWTSLGNYKDHIWFEVVRDDKINLLTDKGELVSDIWYDKIDYYAENIGVKLDGKEGYLDSDGKLLGNTWYERAIFFKDGYGWVRTLDEQEGWIDKDGKIYDEFPL